MTSKPLIRLAAATAMALGSGAALADYVNSGVAPNGSLTGLESVSWASTAAGQTPATITGNPSVPNPGPGPGIVQVVDLSSNATSTYSFERSVAAGTGQYAASTSPLGNGLSYGFVDTWVLNLPAGTAQADVISLNFCANAGMSCAGIQNLTARLYEYSVGANQNLTIGGTAAPPLTSYTDPWSANTLLPGGNNYTAFNSPSLAAGEYVLQVAGQATSGNGGTYAGNLGITPVPLPGSLALLVGGLGLIGGLARRRAA